MSKYSKSLLGRKTLRTALESLVVEIGILLLEKGEKFRLNHAALLDAYQNAEETLQKFDENGEEFYASGKDQQ